MLDGYRNLFGGVLLCGWLSCDLAVAQDKPLQAPAKEVKELELVLQTGHRLSAVGCVAFSPDGSRILTHGAGEAILWDVATGKQLRSFVSKNVMFATLSRDGKRLATVGLGTVTVWDVVTGQKIRAITTHSDLPSAISGDGKRLLTAWANRDAVLWDIDTGEPLRTFPRKNDSHVSLALSDDAKHVLTAWHDGSLVLWDATTGQKLLTLTGLTEKKDHGLGEGRVGVRFVADGKHFATVCRKSVILWDTAKGSKLRTFTLPAEVGPLAFNGDAKRLATASREKAVIFWDVDTGQKMRTFPVHEVWASMALSDDGKQMLTSGPGASAILWDADTGAKLRTFGGRTVYVKFVAVSRDGKRAATASGVTATLWDTQTGRPVLDFAEHPSGINALALSEDGTRLLLGLGNKTAVLWDAVTGDKLRIFERPEVGSIPSVALSRDGGRALVGSGGYGAVLWDAGTGAKLHTFSEKFTGSKVALSADGKLAFVMGTDSVVLWNGDTGQKFRTLPTEFLPQSLAINSAGTRALTGDFQAAQLWDTTSGNKLHTFGRGKQQEHVFGSALSEDGKRMLAKTSLYAASLWDTTSGEKLRDFAGYSAPITSATLTADGQRVLIGSADGTTVWDANKGSLLCRLMRIDEGRDWLVVTPEGLFDGSEAGRQKINWRIGGGLNLVPVDRFFQDFYRPGLLAGLWRGERLMPTVELGKSRPPAVRIASKHAATSETNQVTLEIEAADQGGGLQGPWLYHQGARVLQSEDIDNNGKDIRRRFRVSLVEGDNRFEAKAASGDGSWESEPAVLMVRYAKPLARPTLHLVAVGISKYAEPSFRLKFARNDATALAKLFQSRGNALYREVKVTTLLDEEATGAKIRKTVADVAAQTEAQDTLMLFLAGHGTMVGKRYYFLPQDLKTTPDGNREDEIRSQAIPGDVLVEKLSSAKALRRLWIVDTCASGAVVELFQVAARDPYVFQKDIESMARSHGVYVVAAAAASEQAQEPHDLGHGALSYALLAGLRAVHKGPLERIWVQTSTPNQAVGVLEWFGFAANHVPRLSRNQRVHLYSHGTGFPVLPLGEN